MAPRSLTGRPDQLFFFFNKSHINKLGTHQIHSSMSKDDYFFFSYWIPGEPNNYEGKEENCAELTNEVGRKGWNDLDCQKKNFFLCEKMII